MTVRLQGRRGLPRVDRRRLRARARRLLRVLGRTDAELSIALVDDAEMRELSGRYRSLPRTTDVLAFALAEGPHAERRGAMLGDVVVSVDTARAQARRARRSLDDEVLRLLIHGTLHLLGHDHARAAEARRMRAEERRLWRALNPSRRSRSESSR